MTIKQLIGGLCISLLSGLPLLADTHPETFHALLDTHWTETNKEQIFFRKDPDTFRMNGALPDVSKAGRDRREAFNASILEQLKTIQLEELSKTEQISYRLFQYERQTEAESYRQIDHLYPLNYYASFISYFAAAPNNMSFLNVHDYENYLVSLTDFPRYNAQHITNLKEAISKGHTQFCASFNNYDKNIRKHGVTSLEQSVFFAPFNTMPKSISQHVQQRLTEQGKILIRDTVIPEYQKFLAFFTQEYMPNCRKKIGITQIPGGQSYYNYLIRYYTTTTMNAKDIHQLGLSETTRIRQEMNTIIESVQFQGDFKAFIEFLRTDSRFYTDTPLDLLEKASYISRKMAAQLPKWFSVLPRGTFDIKPSPDGGAYYVGPDGSGTTSGTYFLDTSHLNAMPLYTLEALGFHEAEPGHHFQSLIAQELAVPEFRKTLYHSAYGEGWGLYSERLGKEMGFYQDPYSDFGRLSYEMLRAARLVVDTGMHELGWSRQKAIDFLSENTALSLSNVVHQIDRYITWPGQALSYKIGELKIRQLRAKAEAQLATRFDIRKFHDHILANGSLPMEILEELTNEWIDEEQCLVKPEAVFSRWMQSVRYWFHSGIKKW